MPSKPICRFTGWHMTAIVVAFFGTVAAVNFTMASYASSTFGGVVVKNSYVASQKFNGWLEEARESEALGWNVVTTWRPDGRLVVSVDNAPDHIVAQATARHPLGRKPDRLLTFTRLGEGTYLSDESLPAGRWTLRLELSDGSATWRREDHLS
ncbi:FixH family protein [Aurantiacibacter poecillastricola]|uniref:FixH family protein n=1 Tax=Aurantiacibacter poecillastricola TaxID=3064385 RepID=UPI003530BB9E